MRFSHPLCWLPLGLGLETNTSSSPSAQGAHGDPPRLLWAGTVEEADGCENGFSFDTHQGTSPVRHHLGRAQLLPGAIPLPLPSSRSQYLHFHQP